MTLKSTDPRYNEFTSTYGYVTLHVQKDHHLRDKEPLSISGEAARRIPVCGTCAAVNKKSCSSTA